MSTFNISDITFAGAYAKAVTAAKERDHRNAGRHVEVGEGSKVVKFLKTLARRIAATIPEKLAIADHVTARPA